MYRPSSLYFALVMYGTFESAGDSEGIVVGCDDGDSEGLLVGAETGKYIGAADGFDVGKPVGENVGIIVGDPKMLSITEYASE